jgi:hypothetical protein
MTPARARICHERKRCCVPPEIRFLHDGPFDR